MLDHVSITVSDLPRAARFYDAVMAALRVPCVWRELDAIGYGPRNDAEDDGHTYLTIRATGAAVGADRRHWCFRAPDRAAVAAFHAAGLAHGGTDDGAPGLRSDYHAQYFAAFLMDPDGNRVEAVCHRAEPAPRAGGSGAPVVPRADTLADLSDLLGARRLDGATPPPASYVYAYVELPEFDEVGGLRRGRPLYVGRGSGQRVFDQGRHARELLAGKPQLRPSGRLNYANLPWKTYLAELISTGVPWCVVIVAHSLPRDEARMLEARLIQHFGKRASRTGVLFNVG